MMQFTFRPFSPFFSSSFPTVFVMYFFERLAFIDEGSGAISRKVISHAV